LLDDEIGGPEDGPAVTGSIRARTVDREGCLNRAEPSHRGGSGPLRNMTTKKIVGIVLGLAGFLMPWFFDIPGLNFAGEVTLGIFLMAACFWVLEPVPIYTTSLLVIFLEVLLLSAEGPLYLMSRPATLQPTPATVLKDDRWVLIDRAGTAPQPLEVEILERQAAQVRVRHANLSTNDLVWTTPDHWQASYKPTAYRSFFAALADPIIILFLGGCLLADASVKYRLDRAMTRLFLKPVGERPAMIVLGLLLATAVLSAFMSNTATTAMMMTVILPILARLPDNDPARIAVVLAIPIGANIGGMATPIGTPPNAIALAALLKAGIHIPFGTWVMMALPLVLITLVICWVVLIRLFPARAAVVKLDLEGRFERSPKALALYAVFGVTALLWFTEQQHGISSNIVAFLPVVALPMLGVIGKKEIHDLPWDVFWLMGGGISLGTAIKDTGLATWMVGSVNWGSLAAFAILAGLALFSFLMANFLSHTVTVTLLAPIAISLGASGQAGAGFNLAAVLVTIAIASSYGMTLPISTPPNAIAMGTGVLETRHMVKAGGIIGVVGMVLVLLFARYYWPLFIP
jgi:solute carrier family 13 (sodium-dependent dicarboxylate transporter), member 2/3/5